jgi:hypothetical protein
MSATFIIVTVVVGRDGSQSLAFLLRTRQSSLYIGASYLSSPNLTSGQDPRSTNWEGG